MDSEFSDIFLKGNFQNAFFKTLEHLSKTQKELVYDFAKSVNNNKALCGKNKGQFYNGNHLFHYHIGYKSYNDKNKKVCDHAKCYDLLENTDGFSSQGVIYYVKEKNKIKILAFGEEHCPFPKNDFFIKIFNTNKI